MRSIASPLAIGFPVFVVTNSFMRVPQDPLIARVAVAAGPNAADDWIAERADASAIVITADLPLADRCVKAGAAVIAPNGRAFTTDSIGMALAPRRNPRRAGKFAEASAEWRGLLAIGIAGESTALWPGH